MWVADGVGAARPSVTPAGSSRRRPRPTVSRSFPSGRLVVAVGPGLRGRLDGSRRIREDAATARDVAARRVRRRLHCPDGSTPAAVPNYPATVAATRVVAPSRRAPVSGPESTPSAVRLQPASPTRRTAGPVGGECRSGRHPDGLQPADGAVPQRPQRPVIDVRFRLAHRRRRRRPADNTLELDVHVRRVRRPADIYLTVPARGPRLSFPRTAGRRGRFGRYRWTLQPGSRSVNTSDQERLRR